ncbi:MAG: FtsK/SpoIIIE domain-containing protein [Chloroflexota bacterium]
MMNPNITSTHQFYNQTMMGLSQFMADELKLVPHRSGIGQPSRAVYQIQQAKDTPRTISVQLVINPRYLDTLRSHREALSMAAKLDGDQSIRITRGYAGRLTLEIPKPETLWFNIGIADLPQGQGLKTAVGLDQTSQPTLVNFGYDLTPHALIAGTTGSGKTNLEQLLVHNLTQYNTPEDVQIILVDVEKRGKRWNAFNRLAHLAHPVVIEEEEAQQILTWAVAEVDKRRKQHRSSPRLFLFIDEMQQLVKLDGVIDPIVRIAQMGREYGVHFIGAVQDPTKDNLGHTDIQRNIPLRLVGRVTNATAAYIATAQKQSGADQLVGAGDFLVLQPGQMIQRVAIALLQSRDIGKLPRLEQINRLDFAGLDDTDHVLDVTQKPGRPIDEYDWDKIGHMVGRMSEEGMINEHTARRWFNVGLNKANRFLDAAGGILGGLQANGYEVVKTSPTPDQTVV